MYTKYYPSIEYLRQCLRYEDGRVFWLQRPRDHFKTTKGFKTHVKRYGDHEAGGLTRSDLPQWAVRIDNSLIYRSLIVWALCRGEWIKWPQRIDHENRNRLDDRIENLRIATQSQNMANAELRSTNTSGYKGVHWVEHAKKWRARIKVNYKVIHLGYFDSPGQAHAAYVKAAKQHFGVFACDGNPIIYE